MITVVVLAYNEKNTISKCLKAIAPQECELITVVGGNDGTEKIARKYSRVIKDTACIGAGAARNQGAKAASGEIVLFTDGDTIVPDNWVASYEKIFQDKRVVAAGGVVRPLGGTVFDKLVYKINQDWLYKITALFGFYQLSGNNCGYRKKDFLAAGGFDEEMSFLEDSELPFRMKKRGKIVVTSTPVWTSIRRMKKGYFRVWLQFMRAYFEWLVLGKKPSAKYFASAKKAKD